MLELQTLPLSALVEYLFNPRKSFDPVKLAELAQSIKTSGVLQPLLVRPLPGARVADTDRCVQFEIIAGARRFRAAQMAQVETIPVIVRELDDSAAMEACILENLQRTDLTELEEAEGYQTLMQTGGLSVDAIAAKIAKSRSHVFARLKLLDLSPDPREALRTGTLDASTALLVARIPDSKLQTKALQEIVQGIANYMTGKRCPMSLREAKAHIQQHYMMRLDTAKFDIQCLDLVPTAGSCMTCTQRTGHDPDLFADVKGADVCTNPSCFQKKTEAHNELLVAKAQAKGQTVITGREAQELVAGNGYIHKFKGYKRLDDASDSPTEAPLRKIIGKQMTAEGIAPILIEHPQKKGELVAVLTNETVVRLLKTVQGQAEAAKKVSKEVKQMVDEKAAKAQAKAVDQFERDWRKALLKDAWCEMRDDKDIADAAFDADVHRYLAVRAARSLSTDDAAAICQVLDLGKISPVTAVTDYAKETPHPDQLQLLIIMQQAADPHDHSFGSHIANEGLMLVAGNIFDGTLDGVIEEIKAETKAKIWPDAAKPPGKPAPAAQAKGGGGKSKDQKAQLRKLSAKDAQAAIAAAMQESEGCNPGADAQGQDESSSQPVASAAADASEDAQAVESPAPGKLSAELADYARQSYAKKVAEAKPITAKAPTTCAYRGPNGESWTGRGLMPRWMSELIKQTGGNREDYRVAA